MSDWKDYEMDPTEADDADCIARRDWFAGLALPALITLMADKAFTEESLNRAAHFAVVAADALLDKLEQA